MAWQQRCFLNSCLSPGILVLAVFYAGISYVGYEASDSRRLWATVPRGIWAWSRPGGCCAPLWMATKPWQITGTGSKAPAQHTTRSLCNCAVMAIGTGAGIYV